MSNEQNDNRLRNSIVRSEEHSNNIVDVKLKRKLQYEIQDVTLPLSKCKFRDRLRVIDQDNVRNPENLSMKSSLSVLAFQAIRNGPGGEYKENSNNENEGYDTTMILDFDYEEDESSGESFHKDLSSTSSSSTRNSIIGNNTNPFDDDNSREASKRTREVLKDALETDKRSKGGDDHFGGLEGYDGCNFSEILETGIGQMLYSNGMLPSAFIDSSGKWYLEQDSPVRPKKLTIDQEFEKYFSMLML